MEFYNNSKQKSFFTNNTSADKRITLYQDITSLANVKPKDSETKQRVASFLLSNLKVGFNSTEIFHIPITDKRSKGDENLQQWFLNHFKNCGLVVAKMVSSETKDDNYVVTLDVSRCFFNSDEDLKDLLKKYNQI
jgi:hypothetical protein